MNSHYNLRSNKMATRAQRKDMWFHSREVDRKLEEFGARTHGTIQQREDRLERFEKAARRKVTAYENVEEAKEQARKEYNARLRKRVAELQADNEYTQSFWSPPRDPETGESPAKRKKLTVQTEAPLKVQELADRIQILMDSALENPTLANVQELKQNWVEFSKMMLEDIEKIEAALELTHVARVTVPEI